MVNMVCGAGVTDTAVALEGLINEIVEEVLGIDPREDLGDAGVKHPDGCSGWVSSQ